MYYHTNSSIVFKEGTKEIPSEVFMPSGTSVNISQCCFNLACQSWWRYETSKYIRLVDEWRMTKFDVRNLYLTKMKIITYFSFKKSLISGFLIFNNYTFKKIALNQLKK